MSSQFAFTKHANDVYRDSMKRCEEDREMLETIKDKDPSELSKEEFDWLIEMTEEAIFQEEQSWYDFG